MENKRTRAKIPPASGALLSVGSQQSGPLSQFSALARKPHLPNGIRDSQLEELFVCNLHC